MQFDKIIESHYLNCKFYCKHKSHVFSMILLQGIKFLWPLSIFPITFMRLMFCLKSLFMELCVFTLYGVFLSYFI